ncbi:MAG: helix-turn-helix domain-containing protein [Lachnospiraceae bacterium]|nr:helix-turn-helix domain-containing protein [Lachnospiraceae bacterium]
MKLYIKELREQYNMTQKDLADRLQVSFQTISKWENGVNLPDITHIPRLADVFGVSADVILGLEPMNPKADLRKYDGIDYWNENRELIKIWKALYWNEDYFEFLVRDVWKFDRPMDILDFGCGYGFLGRKFMPLLPKGSSYTGIELDEGQIKEAQDYFDQTAYSHQFIRQDIYTYEPVKKYDLVVALFLLSYMHHPEQLIQKMKESLRPGGMLLLIDANLEVEQAGYFSGLEKEENGMPRPDFIPVWEYEMSHQEQDYRMGTKLPYLLKKCGFQHIGARLSDQVTIYEPSDEEKGPMNDIFRYVYEHEDCYRGGMNYFMNRGAGLQKASEYMDYYEKTKDYFQSEDAIAVKTSGVYFVYATI